MSIFASILRSVYKLSGAKKAFALPEDALRKEIEKQNRHRGAFTPTDHKAYYETITANGFPCLIVRERPKPSKRAILYFFGGGMVIGPDKGDLPVMRPKVHLFLAGRVWMASTSALFEALAVWFFPLVP